MTPVRLAVRVPDPGFTTLPGRVTGLTTTDPVAITDESGVGWWAWGRSRVDLATRIGRHPPGESRGSMSMSVSRWTQGITPVSRTW